VCWIKPSSISTVAWKVLLFWKYIWPSFTRQNDFHLGRGEHGAVRPHNFHERCYMWRSP
jgi:hypothetical protein